MNRLNRILIECAFVLGISAHAFAQTPGSSCENAIPLGKDYAAPVTGEGIVWYSAWTFDLPIKVCFSPSDPSAPAPEVEMDFTCTPGYYEDSILCSLFSDRCGGGGIQLDMPHKVVLEYEDGAYCVSMGKSYRDLLLSMGISYNLQVYIKVNFHSAGTLSMVPNTEFADCMDNGKFIHLGDTVQVKAEDKERHVVLPYVQWAEDSIRYVWTGTKPLTIAVANTCGIDPLDNSDERIVDFLILPPGDTAKLTAAQVKYYAEFENAQAGMYYGKFYSKSPGVLKIERVPMVPPSGGAKLLHYGQAVTVLANDTDALFAIPTTWTNAIQLTAETEHIVDVYVGTTADFTPETAIASRRFSRQGNRHWAGFTETEMKQLWGATNHAYLYVRFQCSTRVDITPTRWKPSDCVVNSMPLTSGESFRVNRNSTTIYKLYYPDIKGGDLIASWDMNYTCKWLVSYECAIGSSLSSTNLLAGNTIPQRGSSYAISAAEIDAWQDRVDEEGYIYMRFVHDRSTPGNITVISAAPEQKDPEYPRATIDATCGESNNSIVISVSENQPLELANAQGQTVSQWTAEKGESYPFTLEPGEYTLSGANETITLHTGVPDMVFSATRYAAITPNTATEISEAVDLKIRNSANYLRFLSTKLPATITYVQDSAFGYYPELVVDGKDTLSAERSMEGCSRLWQWEIPKDRQDHRVTVIAHEDAILRLQPYACHPDIDTVAEVWDSIIWRGNIYRESGRYRIVRQAEQDENCEYMQTLILTVHHTSYNIMEEHACDSYELGGRTYTASGEYILDTTYTSSGDRTVNTLRLTVGRSSFVSEVQTSCGPYKGYTASGVYTDTALNISGCDSVHVLNLTVYPQPETTETTAEAWDSLVWNGKTYTESGIYTAQLTTADGCNYMQILRLTIHQTLYSYTDVFGCDSVTYNGVIYKESCVLAQDTVYTSDGNRLIPAVRIGVGHTSYNVIDKTVCGRYESPIGKTYYQSGKYTELYSDAFGCDSLVVLNLTVEQGCETSDTIYFCEGMNTRHETWEGSVIHRYEPYVYQSPAEWNYMEGVVIAGEKSRTLMDLNRAETNLREHYKGELMPVQAVMWSLRRQGSSTYDPVTVQTQPQWVDAGRLSLQVLFLCGNIYSSDFTTDTELVQTEEAPVKELRNGQVVIRRGGARYNLLGVKIE